jgi:hypothetical protein
MHTNDQLVTQYVETRDGRAFVPDVKIKEAPMLRPVLEAMGNYFRYDFVLRGFVGPEVKE